MTCGGSNNPDQYQQPTLSKLIVFRVSKQKNVKHNFGIDLCTRWFLVLGFFRFTWLECVSFILSSYIAVLIKKSLQSWSPGARLRGWLRWTLLETATILSDPQGTSGCVGAIGQTHGEDQEVHVAGRRIVLLPWRPRPFILSLGRFLECVQMCMCHVGDREHRLPCSAGAMDTPSPWRSLENRFPVSVSYRVFSMGPSSEVLAIIPESPIFRFLERK
jgi:hypothetical protein